MTNRLFLMLERQQKLDAQLRLAQTCREADSLEIAHLRARKLTLRARLARLMQPSALRLA